MSNVLFKRREREIGNAVEIVARKSCNEILEKEKKKAETESQNQGEKDGLVGIAVSYDMGWQKRGKGHNSLTGHGTAMGLVTGKVLSYATRCKSCRVCDSSKRSGKAAKNHDCRKNHAGSSKSMERDVACELWRSAPKAGVKFSTYVGDDDSTTLADIHAKVPYDVQKWSDTVHTKRSLTSRLYNLKERIQASKLYPNCSALSQKVISYFAKCFSYAISQNAGNPDALKATLNCIVPHAFGDHRLCDISWCGYKKSPSTYKHTDLPHGKDLIGEPLKNTLTSLFSEYATDIVVNKLSPCANSQRNESINSTIATKNPKTKYYGGSESSDFRTACGVAQRNVGYSYVSRVLEALNIEPGYFCESNAAVMDKKLLNDRNRKSKKNFKYRRNQLHNQKTSQTLRKEAKEGKTYETSVGLNLDTNATQPSPTAFDIEHILDNISPNELREYEKMVPPYTPKPNPETLTYGPTKSYSFIVFDTETTCTGKQAEICQLSAINETNLTIFSRYILPKNNISPGATRVNKLSVKNINVKRQLFKENKPVQTVSLDEALQEFLAFLVDSHKKDSCTILIGHNSSTFDTPILLRKSDTTFHCRLKDLNVYFADSHILVKDLLKQKHPALQLPSGQFCKSNQSSLYSHLFNEDFEAHDALEDAEALKKIIFESPLQLSKEKIVNCSAAISISQALDNVTYLDRRHELLQTFNPTEKIGISQSMAQNIAGAGLSYCNLRDLYLKSGAQGLLAILSMPHSQCSSKQPRVSRTKRILATILNHFHETTPREE